MDLSRDNSAFEVVRGILVEQCDCDKPMTLESRLIEDLGLESMALMILLTELENHYRVHVDVQNENGLRTIGDIVHFIERQQTEGPSASGRVVINTPDTSPAAVPTDPNTGAHNDAEPAANSSAHAELSGPETVPPDFATVTEAWLKVTDDASIGITFHTLRDDRAHYSYRALVDRSLQMAGALIQRGVEPGDRVAIVLPTSPEFIASFFGVMLARGIAAPLYPPMTAQGMAAWQDRTRALLGRLKPRLIITDARLRETFADTGTPALTYHDIVDGADTVGPNELPAVAPEDIAFIQFSSGTTVDPKPVALSHRNLIANITAIGNRYRDREEPVRHNLCWAPLYHDLGLIGNVLVPVVWNARNELFPPQDFVARPWLWLQRLGSTGATLTAAPNFAFYLCLKRIQDRHMEGVDLSHVRIMLNCAEPIHPDTVREFEERFAKYGLRPGTVIPAYGLAEVSLAASIAHIGDGLGTVRFDREALAHGRALPVGEDHPPADTLAIASAGTPIMGTTIRVADREDPGRLLPASTVGEILVRSPSVLEGYFQTDGTVTPHPDAWLHTGDLGFIHDGRVFVSGRKKDLIIYSGRNLYPQHLEESISRVEGVRDGLCVAVAHQAGDHEELWLFAEGRDKLLEDPIPARELAAAVTAAVLGDHGLKADVVYLLDKHSIPRTTSGKVRRSRTLDLFRAGQIKARFTYRPRENGKKP